MGKLLGTRYGGDRQTTFAVPDLRGLFIRGTDHGQGTDPDGGSRAVGSVQLTATGLPVTAMTLGQQENHTHQVNNLPNDDRQTAVSTHDAEAMA